MTNLHHFSFDLWLTLIRSNPLFKQARVKFFYENFNFNNKSIEEISLVFRQVDLMVNAINEKTGGNIDAEEMYLMVISIINDYTNSFDNIDLYWLYNMMEELVLEFSPVIYSPNTIPVLKKLKNTSETTISILSNTGFIKGSTLRKILIRLELDSYFNFQIYSDEVGFSKPNKKLYNLLLNRIAETRSLTELDLKRIIHIGDNPIADVAGANAVGINSLLINSNNLTILNLLN